MGRTFYPTRRLFFRWIVCSEQPCFEPLGLVPKDRACQVHVRPRRLHVGVPGFRHQCDRVRAGSRYTAASRFVMATATSSTTSSCSATAATPILRGPPSTPDPRAAQERLPNARGASGGRPSQYLDLVSPGFAGMVLLRSNYPASVPSPLLPLQDTPGPKACIASVMAAAPWPPVSALTSSLMPFLTWPQFCTRPAS